MRVIAASQVTGQGVADTALKRVLNEYVPNPPRRVDRLTLLALLGAAPLKQALHPDSGIYLAATYPARPNMFGLLEAVCVQHRLPKPFEFVNSVSNAAGFHVAQQLGINGPNLFIGAGPQVWGNLLELAGCDLEHAQVRQALLMLIDEDNDGGFSVQSLLLESGGDALAGRSFEALSGGVEVLRVELSDAD
jgi:hypothetical protein